MKYTIGNKYVKHLHVSRLHVMAILLCGLLSVIGCHNDVVEEQNLIPVGSHVPSFEVKMNDGRIFSSDSLSASTTVIVFFSTTCPDCRQELPIVDALHSSLLNNEAAVDFVCISRAQAEADVAAYWQEQGLTLPYSAQENKRIFSLFARSRIPRIYIVDAEGIVHYVHDDNPLPDFDTLEEEVRATTNYDKK